MKKKELKDEDILGIPYGGNDKNTAVQNEQQYKDPEQYVNEILNILIDGKTSYNSVKYILSCVESELEFALYQKRDS